MHEGHPPSQPSERQLYWRRWVTRAFSDATDFLGLHPGPVLSIVVATPVGYVLWAAFTNKTQGIAAAGEPTTWVLVGFGGVLILLTIVFGAALLAAPRKMERESEATWKARESELLDLVRLGEEEGQALTEKVNSTMLPTVKMVFDEAELSSVDCSDTARADWIKAEGQRLIGPLAANPSRPKYPFEYAGLLNTESREPEEYRGEIQRYIEAMGNNWTSALRRGAIDREVARLNLAIVNLTDMSIEGVAACVTLPPDVGAGWDEDTEEDGLPKRPRLWGIPPWQIMSNMVIPLRTGLLPGQIERLDGRLRVTWKRVDLGAEGREKLPALSLFIPSTYAGRALPIEWSLTSRRTRGVAKDSGEVGVQSTPLPPGRVLDQRVG